MFQLFLKTMLTITTGATTGVTRSAKKWYNKRKGKKSAHVRSGEY